MPARSPPTLFLWLAMLIAGCDYCTWHSDDPSCPPPRTTAQEICDRLVACGRFAVSDYDVCVRNHEVLGEDPYACLECVEATECDQVDEVCLDAC